MAIPVSYDMLRHNASDLSQHKAMTHNWDLLISVFPDPLLPLVGTLGGKHGGINTSLTQVTGLPNSNMAEGIIAGDIRGVPFHQVGGRETSVRAITLTMNEYYDYRLYRLFEAWKGMAVNRFDWSQNLEAMIPQGVSIVWSDTDRRTPKLTYNLFDVVCTQCQLGDYGSDPQLGSVTAQLKCGYYEIVWGTQDETGDGLESDELNPPDEE